MMINKIPRIIKLGRGRINDKIVFIKLLDPTPTDIKYTKMILENWNNYYKPENYLLPNTKLVESDRHMDGVEK